MRGARGGAGAAQVVVDLILHHPGLFAHHVGQNARRRPRLGQHDGQRRLQRMGQIADVGALALDRLLVVRQQAVDLFGQGLDFQRITALDPVRAPLAHIGNLVAQIEQGAQAHPHLNEHRRDQPRTQQQHGDPGHGGELARVRIDIRPVDPGEEDDGLSAARKLFHAGGDAQGLALGPVLGVVADGLTKGAAQPVR